MTEKNNKLQAISDEISEHITAVKGTVVIQQLCLIKFLALIIFF